MPAFKILSHEGISPPRPDGKIYVRGVFGTSPLGDSQTHEFEFENKQGMLAGIRATEEKLNELDYCHLSIASALKADPSLGKSAMDARIGRVVNVDLTGAVSAISLG